MAGGPPDSSDDLSLMRAIANGDRRAFAQLYDRHAPLLFSVCRRILRDFGSAEDILIDVFLEVWSRSDRFDASRGSPLTYLITLTRSRAIDRRRAESSRLKSTSKDTTEASRPTQSENPADSADSSEQQKIVRTALAALDADQRQALECAFFEGLSHSEIAVKLQKPLGTVKTYIRQGLIRLRDNLRTNQEERRDRKKP